MMVLLEEEKRKIIASTSNDDGIIADLDKPRFAYSFVKNLLKPGNQRTLDNFVTTLSHISTRNSQIDFNKSNFLRLYMNFHIENQLPLNFVTGNKSFQDLIYFCCNNNAIENRVILKLPTRNTVKHTIVRHFINVQKQVASLLQSQASLCFTTDVWRSETGTSYL